MKLFTRWAASGRYRLPMPVLRLLEQRLGCRRNQAAAQRAHRLAGFLAQMHAATGRGFALDRRALFMKHGRRKGAELATRHSPDNPDTTGQLDMSLEELRGAIEILEEIGFVARAKPHAGWSSRGPGAWCRRALSWSFGQIFERVFLFCRTSPINISKIISSFSSVSLSSKIQRENLNTIYGGVGRRPVQPPAPPRPVEINPALERVLARLAAGVSTALA